VGWPTPFAPWALPQLHATTRWSAPHQCIGTFGLAGPPLEPFPLAAPARFSRSARKPRLESCPLYAGRHRASHQAPARLLPGQTCDPGFGVIAVLSTRPRGFAGAPRSSPHLTGAPAFSLTLPTGAFDPSRSWRFGASPWRAAPKGLPSSSVQPRDAEGTGHHSSRNCLIFLDRVFDSSIVIGDPAVPKHLATSRGLAFLPHPAPPLVMPVASEPVVTSCAA
jgi:hypothetical protein